jgi:hypothetical protein
MLSEVDGASLPWNTLVAEMLTKIPDSTYAVSTPVWYEIAQWHPGSHKNVQEKIAHGCPGIYKYAGYTIPNTILLDAAWYKCQTRQKDNNPDTRGTAGRSKDKISMTDALIAAYCLRHGYYVLTLNNQDFTEKFFEIVHISNAPSTTNNQRDFAVLLKPRLDAWRQSRNTVSTEIFF